MTEVVRISLPNSTGKPVDRFLAMMDDRGLVSASIHLGTYIFDENRVKFQAEPGVHYQFGLESEADREPAFSLLWDGENSRAVFGSGGKEPNFSLHMDPEGGALLELYASGGFTITGVGSNRRELVP